MINLIEQMEIADAQTRSKRKNRLLLYKVSEMDEVIRKNNDKMQAIQDLKPMFPWTDKFRQGDFIIRKLKGGVQSQIYNTKQQIKKLQDLREEIDQEQIHLHNIASYPGRGNDKMDLDDAGRETIHTINNREQEKNLLQNLSHQKLAVAIYNLRPQKGKFLYVSDHDILRMTALERATFLTETLGADESTIMSAASIKKE